MDSYLAHHGIPGQKWGVRRYQNYDGSLTPAGRERYGESKQLASQLFEKAKAHEPRITKDVTDSVKGTSAKMYGLENKLKTEESLTRKIRTDSEEKKITPFDAASDIKDGVRYTALSPDKDFTSNYYKIKDSLEKKGYSEVRCKNYFDLYRQGQVKHKSVQSVFRSDDGYLFEMQFQTPASQDAKDKKVPIYEERRKPGLSKERKESLERQMVELAENVPDPKDVYKIKTHSGVKHSLGGDSMTYDELVHALFSDEDDHLEHHGILGQKWGKQNGPPYPLDRDDHSAEEKKLNKFTPSGVIARYKERKEAKRKAEEKAARVQKMKEGKERKAAERKAAEEHEAAKQKALKSGNAEEVAKFKDELSYAELNEAVNRIDLENRLKAQIVKANPTQESAPVDDRSRFEKATALISKYGKMASNAAEGAEGMIKAYNTVAKVMNSVTDSDWPTIEKTDLKTKIAEREKKAREAEEQERKDRVDKLVRSGDVEEINRRKSELTNDELNNALKRLDNEDRLDRKVKTLEYERSLENDEKDSGSSDSKSEEPTKESKSAPEPTVNGQSFGDLVKKVSKDMSEGKDSNYLRDPDNENLDGKNAWQRYSSIRYRKRR